MSIYYKYKMDEINGFYEMNNVFISYVSFKFNLYFH